MLVPTICEHHSCTQDERLGRGTTKVICSFHQKSKPLFGLPSDPWKNVISMLFTRMCTGPHVDESEAERMCFALPAPTGEEAKQRREWL